MVRGQKEGGRMPTANELRDEVQRIVARLQNLLRRQCNAVTYSHENTLVVVRREIGHLTARRTAQRRCWNSTETSTDAVEEVCVRAPRGSSPQ